MKLPLSFLFFALTLFGIHAQGENVVLLSQKTEIEIRKNNTLIKKHLYQIQINNRAGEKYTHISIPYTRKNRIQNLKAFIKDMEGNTIRELKKSEIVDRSNISHISLYEDNMVKEFALTHNKYPYVISYSYQEEESEFLYIDYWIPILDYKIPTLSAELTLTVSPGYPFSVSKSKIDDYQYENQEKGTKHSWKTSYTKPLPLEALSPPIYTFLPFVKIVPQAFKYDKKGSLKDWKSFGNWEYELLKGLNDLPQSEKNRIAYITALIPEKRDQIRALYRYLQDETRYINVSIDKGGLKPYPASYVVANKYGDCKALTNYMKALLEECGISSYYTNVYAGENIREIDKDFPSQQFNHVILFIPLEKDSIWLDCTSKGPFGYLGTFSQNRNAFVIDKENSRFIRTPALSKEQVLCSRKTTVILSEEGKAEMRHENIYRGKPFETIRLIDAAVAKSDRKKFIQQNIAGNEYELISYEIPKNNRDEPFIRLNYTAISNRMHKIYGTDMLLTNPRLHLPSLEKPHERKLPLRINYPVYEKDTIIYHLPEGYRLVAKPENCNIENRFGEYRIDYESEGNTIKVTRTFLLNSGYFSHNEYNAFYLFIDKINSIQNSHVLTLTQKE